ncbi:MAG: M20/M25/M40 family metallo-hydrolase [Solirubrobacteraceae bacterium]|nr:M20/M25/M40 family metallo-hydrolase [Solirubrobacteraceae bacterium]
MTATATERAVVEAVARRRRELVDLAARLVAFDTTAGAGTGQEAALQAHLAERLRAAGAEVDLWVPGDGVVAGSRQVPAGFTFGGRPQLAARLRGRGGEGGRSLLFNGHVDVVPAGDPAAWTTPPFDPVVRDGRLHGRGACDMKGGVAAMVVAAEVLAEHAALAGDLVVCTVTDEEETGAGAIAAVARGVRADAGLIPEPTGFDAWVACRGDVIAEITVRGRLGHAGIEHPPGDAVNAIEKARVVMSALRRLHDARRARPDHRHPHLSPGHVIPTRIRGGDWPVNAPDACTVTYHVAYLPAHADADGWGTAVEAEVEAAVRDAAAADPWLAAHPPEVRRLLDIPAAEVAGDEPIIDVALAAAADLGRPGRRAGLDSWHDGATFTRFGATPTIAVGPPSIDRAHTVDESVPVDDLVACAQLYALAALRFLGTVGG